MWLFMWIEEMLDVKITPLEHVNNMQVRRKYSIVHEYS